MQQRPTIPDIDIPGTDADTLIFCFSAWIQKIANRYINALERTGAGAVIDTGDLFQVGSLALLRAQKGYDPAGGASFLHYSQFYIRAAMIREITAHKRPLPRGAFVSLDEPITADGDDSLSEIIPDKSIVPFDDAIITDETRNETITEVRAAVARLKSKTQREIIERVHFAGESKETAAAAMGIKRRTFSEYERHAREKLHRDFRLRQFVYETIPFFHVGASRFNSSWESAVEKAVLWRENKIDYLYGPGAFLDGYITRGCPEPPARTWSPAQQLAQMKRRQNERSSTAPER